MYSVQCFTIFYIASNAEFSARWVISRSQFDAGGWLWETRQHQPLICSSAYMQQATNPAWLMHEKSAHIFRGAHFHADSRGWTLSCLLSSIRAQCIKRPQAQGVAQATLVFSPAAFEGFFVEKISLFDIYEHSKVGYQAMEISYQKHLLLKFDWFAEDS